MSKQDKLIKDLYVGLKEYYSYVNNLEDTIYKLDLDEVVFELMPEDGGDFDHKDCRFLLEEVKNYLTEIGG